jgi:DNA repair exonuclease SbcCD ATPase subunit
LSGVKESGIEVMELADKLHKRQERLEELRELVGNIEKQGDSLVESMKELKVLHAQLEKEMDGKCPLCKQSIKGERIWNVL